MRGEGEQNSPGSENIEGQPEIPDLDGNPLLTEAPDGDQGGGGEAAKKTPKMGATGIIIVYGEDSKLGKMPTKPGKEPGSRPGIRTGASPHSSILPKKIVEFTISLVIYEMA